MDLQGIQAVIEQEEKNAKKPSEYTFDEYIGNCGFNELDENRGEIGITIRKQMQGKHYAKDIIRGLIEYGFSVLNLDEILKDKITNINATFLYVKIVLCKAININLPLDHKWD